LEYINEKYKIEINGLYTLNSQSIIKDESTLQLNFQEAYYHAIGKNKEDKSHLNKSIYFKILADVMNDEDTHVRMPKFKYIIK
jgi:hypothetical protein